MRPLGRQSGVTLLEMMVVVTLISIFAAISYPSISAGIDSIRLSSASETIVSFLTGALNRAERRQEIIEVAINKKENAILLRSTQPGFAKRLDLPPGISIVGVLPALAEAQDVRRFVLLPGGTVPRLGVQIADSHGGRRTVRVDPFTGMAQVERPEEKK